MSLYGLIGYPLSHSFSKKYFTKKFEEEDLKNCAYENFPIPSINELKEVLALPALQGFNVTIPFKELVIPFLHHSSEIVKKIGACNCIKILEGKLYGFNTDVFGFENSLANKLDPAIHHRALILGTGGSSKAVRFVLEKLKIRFTSVSRKPAAGCLSYEQITKEIIQSNQLIINTTPLGMFPNIVEAPPLPYQFLTPSHYLVDLIYNPEKTLFLKKGEDCGAQIQNGYEMLVLQAEKSWEIWNNPVELLTGNF
jgi:shikimate dehydrogenase